jgi:hypothetical protein
MKTKALMTIPGDGPVVDRAAVTAHHDMILTFRDRVAAMIKKGKTGGK